MCDSLATWFANFTSSKVLQGDSKRLVKITSYTYQTIAAAAPQRPGTSHNVHNPDKSVTRPSILMLLRSGRVSGVEHSAPAEFWCSRNGHTLAILNGVGYLCSLIRRSPLFEPVIITVGLLHLFLKKLD